MSEDSNFYTLHYTDNSIADENQSRLFSTIMTLHPHKSADYTWDDLGIANLICDCYKNDICYCPQNDSWYIWNGRWVKQPEDGVVFDYVETILNLLGYYIKEQTWAVDNDSALDKDAKDKEKDALESYSKYIKSIRKRTAMRNIIAVLATKLRKQLTDFDLNPYVLNTPYLAYDLRDNSVIDIEQYNVTMCTNTTLPDFMTTPCDRWYQFIDEIMSHDKEKAAFLQRALGYSLLGVNKEECMFIAYGAQSRNGKGTLFRSLENALGSDYMKTASPMMICERRNGELPDFNAPQPMLAELPGARIVDMSESTRGIRLDSAAMKTITGRDTLVTRSLFEKPFRFVPQFTIWLNTNYLPNVNDDTVFLSDRVWVIEFNEHFDANNRDTELKELFAQPENLPTILGWLVDGCRDYMQHGLNVPDCVKEATNRYRNQNDRVGCFIRECCDIDATGFEKRGNVYQAYREWCSDAENKYTPIGSTTFYEMLGVKGYKAKKRSDAWYITGLCLNGKK